jgi:amino acid transporter
VTSDGQPKNAVTVIYVFGAAILCTILPSQVAFTSLVSAGAIPTIAAYGLIPLLRLTMTPNHFQSSHFRLGRLAKPFYVCAVFFNGLIFAVCILLPHSPVAPFPHRLHLTGHDLPFLLPRGRRELQLRMSVHFVPLRQMTLCYRLA